MAQRLSRPKDLEWKKLCFAGNTSFYITHDSFISPSKPFINKEVKKHDTNGTNEHKGSIQKENKCEHQVKEDHDSLSVDQEKSEVLNIHKNIDKTNNSDNKGENSLLTYEELEGIDGITQSVRKCEAEKELTNERVHEIEIPFALSGSDDEMKLFESRQSLLNDNEKICVRKAENTKATEQPISLDAHNTLETGQGGKEQAVAEYPKENHNEKHYNMHSRVDIPLEVMQEKNTNEQRQEQIDTKHEREGSRLNDQHEEIQLQQMIEEVCTNSQTEINENIIDHLAPDVEIEQKQLPVINEKQSLQDVARPELHEEMLMPSALTLEDADSEPDDVKHKCKIQSCIQELQETSKMVGEEYKISSKVELQSERVSISRLDTGLNRQNDVHT